MMGGSETAETPLFDDVLTSEPKKFTAVYKRRPKKPEAQAPDTSNSGPVSTGGVGTEILVLRDEGVRNRDVNGRKDRLSWYHRSLSFRGRRSSLMSTTRQPLAGIASNVLGNPSQALLKQKPIQAPGDQKIPTSNFRKTWAGVPASYVKEQRAFFADVDAFDLVAKEAGFSPSPKKPQMRDSLEYALSQWQSYTFQYDEALHLSALSDSELLSAALRTPRPAVAKAESGSQFNPVLPSLVTEEMIPPKDFVWYTRNLSTSNGQGDEKVPPSPDVTRDRPLTRRSNRSSADTFSRRTSSVCFSDSSRAIYQEDEQALPSPEVLRDKPLRRRSSRSSIATISVGRKTRSMTSNDEDLSPVGIFTREDSSFLDFESASLLNRLEALHITEDEAEAKFGNKSLCTPIPEEDAEEEAEEEAALDIRKEETEVNFGKISFCTPIPEEEEEEEDEVEEEDEEQAGEELIILGSSSADNRTDDFSEEDVGDDAADQLKDDNILSAFDMLLQECHQAEIRTLREALADFCNLQEIKKLGEGTFGEAFKGGGNVFKIVPMDGSFKVNDEHQKTSAEILSEVVLSNTLNSLRGGPIRDSPNICSSFIETKATRICQGCYDPELVRAWEEWDALNNSENDHPEIFPHQQFYVVFVLGDGGRDLESFRLENFNESRSLLLQIVLALAVAEEACQFEHRDLHWGNVVLARDQGDFVPFRLLGQEKRVKSFGLSVSLIDFTLSRLDTGKQVMFCNLAADPLLFQGPKNNVQADTYRRMQKVTGGQWEGRFLKTNCLWIHYVADILLTKKEFSCSAQDKRFLRAFRKRSLLYESAGAIVLDSFFDGMWA